MDRAKHPYSLMPQGSRNNLQRRLPDDVSTPVLLRESIAAIGKALLNRSVPGRINAQLLPVLCVMTNANTNTTAYAVAA
jgi:hypothetical protein